MTPLPTIATLPPNPMAPPLDAALSVPPPPDAPQAQDATGARRRATNATHSAKMTALPTARPTFGANAVKVPNVEVRSVNMQLLSTWAANEGNALPMRAVTYPNQ